MNEMPMLAQQMNLDLALDSLDDFVRIPGLLRRWEIEQVVSPGAEYRIEEAGELSDKTQVFAVYRREHPRLQATAAGDVGVPVGLTFDDQQVTMHARLLPISDGEPLMAVLVVGDSAEDAAALAQVREHVAQFATRSATAPKGGAVLRQGQGTAASQGDEGATR